MSKGKMGRPKEMPDMKVTSLSLDRSDLEIIEKEKGDISPSAFIRNLIRETQSGVGGEKDKIIKTLQKNLRDTEDKLKDSKRKEMAITQERKDTMNDIEKSYKRRLLTLPNATQGQQRNWLESQCKGTGISLIEMNVHLREQGLLDSERLEEWVGER